MGGIEPNNIYNIYCSLQLVLIATTMFLIEEDA